MVINSLHAVEVCQDRLCDLFEIEGRNLATKRQYAIVCAAIDRAKEPIGALRQSLAGPQSDLPVGRVAERCLLASGVRQVGSRVACPETVHQQFLPQTFGVDWVGVRVSETVRVCTSRAGVPDLRASSKLSVCRITRYDDISALAGGF